MAKSILSKLKLTEAPVKTTDPLIQRQNKLIAKLEIQREMAQCLISLGFNSPQLAAIWVKM